MSRLAVEALLVGACTETSVEANEVDWLLFFAAQVVVPRLGSFGLFGFGFV